jgi:hypothetical protein
MTTKSKIDIFLAGFAGMLFAMLNDCQIFQVEVYYFYRLVYNLINKQGLHN